MNIPVNILDSDSINRAIALLKQYQRKAEQEFYEIMSKLITDGIKYVREEIVSMGAIDTGELHDSVEAVIYISEDWLFLAEIKVNAEHGVYIEYGTGTLGKTGKPHPELDEINWAHNSGKYSSQWGFWYYPNKNGGWTKTYGQEARPFFYQARKRIEARLDGLR